MKNQAQHTPGTWTARETKLWGSEVRIDIYSDDETLSDERRLICDLTNSFISVDEQRANAHLIVTAQQSAKVRDDLKALNAELLAALEAVISVSDRKTKEYDKAHALIAKAREGQL